MVNVARLVRTFFFFCMQGKAGLRVLRVPGLVSRRIRVKKKTQTLTEIALGPFAPY